jgi:hypothetical protein
MPHHTSIITPSTPALDSISSPTSIAFSRISRGWVESSRSTSQTVSRGSMT